MSIVIIGHFVRVRVQAVEQFCSPANVIKFVSFVEHVNPGTLEVGYC